MRARTWLALAAVLAAAGCTQPLVDRPNKGARSLVIVLDASASMKQSDPARADALGASIALGLLSRKDNVGVVSMSSVVRAPVPLKPAGDAASREEARAAVLGVDRSG